MPEESEVRLLTKLIEKTQQNQVDWQTTGIAGQLAATFSDKFTITFMRTPSGIYILKVKNADGDELTSLNQSDDSRLPNLYKLSRAYTRRQIEDQLSELINEIDKPASPAELARRALRAAQERQGEKK